MKFNKSDSPVEFSLWGRLDDIFQARKQLTVEYTRLCGTFWRNMPQSLTDKK